MAEPADTDQPPAPTITGGERRLLPALLLLAAASAQAQTLADSPQLLQCDIIVTGTDMRSRPAALDRCVREVAIRVTGRPDLEDDPGLAAIAANAPALVEDFAYLDRMTDIPTHDEQGTRDRPYDFIAHVDPAALQSALAAAGLHPWLDRPTLLVLVTVTPRVGDPFPLTGDGLDGERQREAILDASRRYGLRVALPTAAQAADLDHLTPDALHLGGPGKRAVTLRGTLIWSDADFGWNANWQLPSRTWQTSGVSFDAAFRSAVGGAAQALATSAPPVGSP